MRRGEVWWAWLRANPAVAGAPGNVPLTKAESGLPRKSVVNVTQVLSLDRSMLSDRIATLSRDHVSRVDEGLRLVLSL